MVLDPDDAVEMMREEDERDDLVEDLTAQWLEIKHAVKPVRDWYESEEEPERKISEIVTDAVKDLQYDRKECLRLRSEIRASVKLTKEFATQVREGEGPEDVAASLAVSVAKLYDAYEKLKKKLDGD